MNRILVLRIIKLSDNSVIGTRSYLMFDAKYDELDEFIDEYKNQAKTDICQLGFRESEITVQTAILMEGHFK